MHTSALHCRIVTRHLSTTWSGDLWPLRNTLLALHAYRDAPELHKIEWLTLSIHHMSALEVCLLVSHRTVVPACTEVSRCLEFHISQSTAPMALGHTVAAGVSEQHEWDADRALWMMRKEQ